MNENEFNQLVEAVIRQLILDEVIPPSSILSHPSAIQAALRTQPSSTAAGINIDLPDPTALDLRYKPGVINPRDAAALQELVASTPARIGVGRAGPRYTTDSLLLFQADHAITQDALYREVDQQLLDELNLFTVQTQVMEGKQQYLLRPDLGRLLSSEARSTIQQKCVKNPQVQLVIGDGLSAAAIESNLRQIFPVIQQGFKSAGLSMGTPFFVKYCRVGVINDIGDLLHPEVIILLIGERPGLGRADSMSAYMAYRPQKGQNDSDRDVISNIFEKGGTNPLEAGAFLVQFIQKMRQNQASGVKLKLAAR